MVDISRFLGLDVGDARIGLALSDPLSIIATPLKIISRRDIETDVRAIIDVVKKNDVERIIVGLPFSMDGSLGTQAEKVRSFVNELSCRTDVPIEYRDERLSTVAAKRIMRQVGKSHRYAKYDAAAAALILWGYLEDLRSSEDYQPSENADTE